MAGRRPETMAKRAREQAVREKREQKRLKKLAAAEARANGLVLDENGNYTPTMSSGETGTDESSQPVAARSAETIAAVETTVGGSPTPLTP